MKKRIKTPSRQSTIPTITTKTVKETLSSETCNCQKKMYYNNSTHQFDTTENTQFIYNDGFNTLKKPLLNRPALSVESDDGEIRAIHICDDINDKVFKSTSPHPIGDLNIIGEFDSTKRLSALLRQRPGSLRSFSHAIHTTKDGWIFPIFTLSPCF